MDVAEAAKGIPICCQEVWQLREGPAGAREMAHSWPSILLAEPQVVRKLLPVLLWELDPSAV